MSSLNIVFAGTPAFALPCLKALSHSKHRVQAVYTKPDSPAGRGRKLQMSDVKIWAQQHHLPVNQPSNFKDEATLNQLRQLKPDVMVVIAYGLIFPQNVLDIPQFGCINVHGSLLPKWRGASPIQQSLLAGDIETGVTIMQMNAGMDTGDILTQAKYTIQKDTTASLMEKLAHLSVTPLLDTLTAITQKTIQAQPQETHLASYAPKLKKEDAHVHWQKPALIIDREIRAYNPWPISFTHVNDQTMRIHQAQIIITSHQQVSGCILSITPAGILVAAGEDAILIEKFQFPGTKVMDVADHLTFLHDILHTGLILK